MSSAAAFVTVWYLFYPAGQTMPPWGPMVSEEECNRKKDWLIGRRRYSASDYYCTDVKAPVLVVQPGTADAARTKQ